MTEALEGGEWSAARPGRTLPPGKTSVHTVHSNQVSPEYKSIGIPRGPVSRKCSRYRPGVAQRVGRGIVLLFHDRGSRMGVSGQQHAPAALYPRESHYNKDKVIPLQARCGPEGG